MRLVLLALAGLPLMAVDVPMPIVGTGACKITAATNATPVRVTVDDIAACGITSATDRRLIGILHAQNGAVDATDRMSSINLHAENSTDDYGLYRCALNISGNQFDVYKGDCTTAVAGNGSWGQGGLVYRVQLLTMRTGPLLMADGTGGTITTGLTSTASGGWANSGRTLWSALDTSATNWIASYGSVKGVDTRMEGGLVCALQWYGAGKPGSSSAKTCALWSLQNIEQYWPTLACDYSVNNCAQGNSEWADYRAELYGFQMLQLVSLMWDELSAGEKAKVTAFLLNDKPWIKGGHDYTAATWTEPTWKTASGTISVTSGSTTITGTSTSFLSQVAVGDYIAYADTYPNSFNALGEVTAIADDTHLTIRIAPTVTSSTPQSYRIGPPWVDTQAGLLWQTKIYGAALVCGVNLWQTASWGCTDYGSQLGTQAGISGPAATGNHTIGRLMFHLAMGITLGNQDIRARALLAHSAGLWYHWVYPRLLTSWTGISNSSTNGYQPTRVNQQVITAFGIMKNAFTTGPDYLNSSLRDGIGKWNIGHLPPGRGDGDLWFSQGNAAFQAGHIGNALPSIAIMNFWPAASISPELKSANENWSTWTSGNMQGNKWYLARAYVGHRPDITASARTNYTLTLPSLASLCTAQWSANICDTARPRVGILSNTGWATSSTSAFWDMASYSCDDQCTQNNETGLYIAVNGKFLMVPDRDIHYGSSSTQFGNIAISGLTLKASDPNIGVTTTSRMYGSATLAAGTVDLQNHYTTSPGGAVSRSFLHAKGTGTGDYILERITGPSSVSTRYQYYIGESCGTPSSSSCISLSRSGGTLTHTQTGARLLTKVITGTLDTENTSDTNGSYTGGAGYTFRTTVSGSDMLVLHRPTSNASETLPTITSLSAGNLTGAQVGDSKVMLIATTEQSATTSFSTTHSGTVQYAVLGLAAGTWNFKRNGSTVCASVSVVSGEHAASCDMASGTIELEAVGGPTSPTITTSSPLPAGTVGSAYSQTIAATGGTPSYTWSLTSGSCPGLSLSSAGVLSGTPTTAGVCSLTIRCTDATPLYDEDVFSLTINAAPGGGAGAQVRGTIRGVIR